MSLFISPNGNAYRPDFINAIRHVETPDGKNFVHIISANGGAYETLESTSSYNARAQLAELTLEWKRCLAVWNDSRKSKEAEESPRHAD